MISFRISVEKITELFKISTTSFSKDNETGVADRRNSAHFNAS
jgi:hypothetical protein